LTQAQRIVRLAHRFVACRAVGKPLAADRSFEAQGGMLEAKYKI